MPPVERYRWDTSEYAEAFATLLRHYHGRENVIERLRELLGHYPADARAADWGAGSGELTRILLERAATVYAVEPHPEMARVLSERCPRARLVPSRIMQTQLPQPVHVGVLSHVLYHVPDHKWAAHVVHAARQLTPDGVLLVVLKGADSGCNDLLHHFGAPRFDLVGRLQEAVLQQREFEFTFARSRAFVRIDSLEDTLKIARFVLADRDADAFARPPSEEKFRDYVRRHFWDESRQQGGWDMDDMLCLVRPNRWSVAGD
jgi:SAM-dependent methyltransferase